MRIQEKTHKRTIQALIWLSLLGVHVGLSSYFQPIEYALFNAGYSTLCLFIVYRVSLVVLFPYYHINFKKYIFLSLTFLLVATGIFLFIDQYIPEARYEIDHRPPEVFHFLRIFMMSGFIYFIGTSVKLVEYNQRLIDNEKLLTEEKLETELKLLKAQINPHFIFNALNNIYSLTYMKTDNAPDAVLKLSEMLRYVFYDCSKDRVQLSAEINYIENFSAFQQMKSDYDQQIRFSKGNGINSMEIAPMLFVPFIENAFKYSRIEEDENAFVHILISREEDRLLFSIINSVPQDNKPLSGSGTGIKNVRHRLAIIYAKKHQINISEEENQFSVSLSIEV